MANFWSLLLCLNRRQDRGFTFIEVLAGILIALIFTLIATQAIVIGTVFKVRARRISEATNVIRADLEELRFLSTSANPENINSQLIQLCRQSFSTAFINSFASTLPPVDSPVTLLNKSYELRREESYPEWNVLRLSYSVRDIDNPNGVVIAELQAEITPEASAECPWIR